MTAFEFFAFGQVQPQGSSSAFVVNGKARVTSANRKLKPWRAVVSECAAMAIAEAKTARPAFATHEPVRLDLEFVIRRPKSIPKWRKHPVVKPDLDKLVRGIGDALTGIVYEDDAQVVSILASKVYGEPEGVRVRVEEM